MAAPFKHCLSSRLIAHVYDRTVSSCQVRTNNAVNSLIKRRFYSNKNRNFSWRSRSKLWYVSLLGGGVTTAGLLLNKFANCDWKAGKVFADSQERPIFRISRQIQLDTDNSGLKLTLYQFQTCPFCCKVRAVLDYHGFSYDVIEVNSVTKKQIKWADYPKVPILVVEGPGTNQEVVLKDSSAIISVLESYLQDRTTSIAKYWSYYPYLTEQSNGKAKYEIPNRYFVMFQETADLTSTLSQRNEERKWRKWADDHLVHMLSPNVYRTVGESLQTFHYFSDVGDWKQNFSTWERYMVIYVGAAVMYVMGMILKSKYTLKDDVRQSLYDACNEWLKAVGKNRQFMGGSEPNLADLAVYGVLNSIEGCSAFQDALKNTKIGPWYSHTKQAIQTHQGSHPLNIKALPSDVSKDPQKKMK